MFHSPYPFFRQKNMRDCGIASLRMVLAHHGIAVSAHWLRKVTKIDKIGTTFAALQTAAKQLGLDSDGIMVRNGGQLAGMAKEGPLILFVDGNHFIVYYERRGKKHVIGDPGQGKMRITDAQLTKRFFTPNGPKGASPEGYALRFTPQAERPELPEYAYADESGMGQFRRQFLQERTKRLWPFFAVILLGIAATSVLQYVMPYLTKMMVDLGIASGDLLFVKYLLIGQLAVVLGRTTFDILRTWIVLHLSMRINYHLVAEFLGKLYRLPLPFFETRKFGDILQRIRDHGRIEQFITRNSLSILVAAITIVVYCVILFQFNAFFFYIFLVAAGCYLAWTTFFLKARKDIDVERFKYASNNQSILIQTIGGMHDLKINDSQDYLFEKWRDNQISTFQNNFRFLKVNQFQETGSMLIVELSQLLILFLSASLIVNNEISLGALLSIQFITGQLIGPMEQLVQGVIRGQEALISLGRIGEFWDERDEDSYHGDAQPTTKAPSLRIENVSFTHPGAIGRPALNGVNFSIPHGKVTAIVGGSGSGKTTLLKLLLGYYPDYSGEIRLGDQDFCSLDIGAWRRQCGVILQESYLFDESIERNIIMGQQLDRERLMHAAEVANLHEFVSDLPKKFQTLIGREGKGLSMGQKQRILMARAVYKNPQFFFMDEATNSLDADNESRIMNDLRRFFLGRTVVIVAHRLSTIQFADNIVVMDRGRVVEQGSHDELLRRKGRYAQLVQKQLQ